MTKEKSMVRWAGASMAIRDFKNNRKKYLLSCFTAREIRHLARKPLQSAAGFLALKRALVALHQNRESAAPVDEKSLVITHAPDGSPVIAGQKKLMQNALSDIFVSISHTRSHAFGVAAIEVKAHG